MMLKKLSLSLFALALGTGGWAGVDKAELQQEVAQAVQLQRVRVRLELAWQKEVRLRELMARAPRIKENPLIRVDKKQTACQGVLLHGGRQIATPAACVKHGKFTLVQIRATFANGQEVQIPAGQVLMQQDMAFIQLPEHAAQGLEGLPVLKLEPGQTLQGALGPKMTLALHRFFNSFGVSLRRHHYTVADRPAKPVLELGEPVVFEGRLVALVKEVPSRYGELNGRVSERALAVLRR